MGGTGAGIARTDPKASSEGPRGFTRSLEDSAGPDSEGRRRLLLIPERQARACASSQKRLELGHWMKPVFVEVGGIEE